MIFIAISIFLILVLPFFGTYPYLDGNIDFVQSYNLFSGGLHQYLKGLPSVHPPFRYLPTYFSFLLLGVNPLSFSIPGPVFGVVGIVAIYSLTKTLFNRKAALFSALFLASFPLYIANSLFFLTDYFLAILILLALTAYAQKKNLLYSLWASLAVLTKESGMILAGSILLVEAIFFGKSMTASKKVGKINQSLPFLLPPLVGFAWFIFLRLNNLHPWGDWIFSETAEKGAIYTLAYNLLTLNFLNQYAFAHWRQLFILNFHWVYWAIAIVGFYLWQVKEKRQPNLNVRVALAALIFSLTYFLTVLSFPTFTIPRYALPVFLPLLIWVGYSFSLIESNLKNRQYLLYVLLAIIVSLALFTSADPVSRKLWGVTKILGEELYPLNAHLAGNDGLTYNWQFLSLAKKRTQTIKAARDGVATSPDCYWIFPDPNNDFKTAKILDWKINPDSPCLYRQDLSQ